MFSRDLAKPIYPTSCHVSSPKSMALPAQENPGGELPSLSSLAGLGGEDETTPPGRNEASSQRSVRTTTESSATCAASIALLDSACTCVTRSFSSALYRKLVPVFAQPCAPPMGPWVQRQEKGGSVVRQLQCDHRQPTVGFENHDCRRIG